MTPGEPWHFTKQCNKIGLSNTSGWDIFDVQLVTRAKFWNCIRHVQHSLLFWGFTTFSLAAEIYQTWHGYMLQKNVSLYCFPLSQNLKVNANNWVWFVSCKRCHHIQLDLHVCVVYLLIQNCFRLTMLRCLCLRSDPVIGRQWSSPTKRGHFNLKLRPIPITQTLWQTCPFISKATKS